MCFFAYKSSELLQALASAAPRAPAHPYGSLPAAAVQ